MRLGFEKANHSLKDRVMRFGSGGDFIHCQFVFDPYEKISASAWDMYGIGFRNYADTVQNEATHWVFIDYGHEKDEELYDWFRKRLGTPYDYAGLITSFILPKRKPQNIKTFCSEVCYQACQEVLRLNLPKVNENYLSPQGLYNLITTGKP
ncbi:hypothetical protein [Runella salmonicolor]|jgi:hypothetical protein|uniref:Uncharacterized protein n=1 Tax=Runella salmonicolor TaxID=2950278 RepID=A0ABT1FXA9_9BACT|nr:hypothetical protein [Runella salmonicolor]MCP1386409.1 hypothetical protein [Runella salmonicolor]